VQIYGGNRLDTTEDIAAAAEHLAEHLKMARAHYLGEAWTPYIFQQLRKFCEVEFHLEPLSDCFHKGHPDQKGEFIWDFIATYQQRGILLAAECEQWTKTIGQVQDLKHDFGKLLYVFAPLRLLVCKAQDISKAKSLLVELTSYANGCCQNFNPGAAFLIFFWCEGEPTSYVYVWQGKEPYTVPGSVSITFNEIEAADSLQ
jgi:hypothetical protein